MKRSKPQTFIVSGQRACFARPEFPIERVTYPIITPSAARGLFECVHYKPEFKWIISKIEVINPLSFGSVMMNEINEVAKETHLKSHINPTDPRGGKGRIQRNYKILKNVKYRLSACIQAESWDLVTKHEKQFRRYLKKGTFYEIPYLGIRDFTGNIEPDNKDIEPMPMCLDLGLLLWGFDYKDKKKPYFFNCNVKDGVVKVPELRDLK